ncbi:lipopolysaccharide biosynthesis protein [Lachnoclostridium sp. Marseille-P6806]|uniref:lipopolysaccharide biosynthesis protein n=1 Tax=Lachnoclostridium sp. Marseille-P6806 TaxID=2364793 RepID=UPI001032475E|nr:polysaccharide biosynthesis protein [Lachnoclostridium sp. Marseille-P6806]
MGRTKSAAKNIAFGYAGTLTTAILGFLLKQVFISNLSATLNGVNGLYTGILSLLNMAELGIGTALNYSLYAPVARGDREKVRSYMRMYRRAYHVIALAVAGMGLLLTPFLPVFIRNPGDNRWQDLTLYYLIFLFNTVSSYFVAYKYSLVNAEQKNYIQTNIAAVTKIVTVLLQMLVLVTTKNFYFYLLTDAAIQLVQKIFVNAYLNRLYPYLREKGAAPLSKEERGEVWTKTRALVWHRVGDAARLQTDSVIISSFIEVTVSGMVDNYNQVITAVAGFVNIIFNSVISSLGNLIATESREKQFEIFSVYRFFASWIYGFCAAGFFLLLTPFVGGLWLGRAWILPAPAVALILLDFYFKGERIVLSNYKTAAGVFEQDKYLAAVQGIVNLALSVWLVQKIGLTGVYVGTVVSGLIANVTKPIIIYRVCFGRSAAHYFLESLKYAAVLGGILAGLYRIRVHLLPAVSDVTLPRFLIMGVLITLVYNGLFLAVFGRTREARYLFRLVKRRFGG